MAPFDVNVTRRFFLAQRLEGVGGAHVAGSLAACSSGSTPSSPSTTTTTPASSVSAVPDSSFVRIPAPPSSRWLDVQAATEAELENAARGPSGFTWPWGNSESVSHSGGRLTVRCCCNGVCAAEDLAHQPVMPCVQR